ncbi:MAG: hypothetical protein ACRDS9_14410, partial [Pseudonocardiaceae bacterium]
PKVRDNPARGGGQWWISVVNPRPWLDHLTAPPRSPIGRVSAGVAYPARRRQYRPRCSSTTTS